MGVYKKYIDHPPPYTHKNVLMGVGLFLNILTTPLHTQKCFIGGGGLQKYIDHPTQTHKNGLMGDGGL